MKSLKGPIGIFSGSHQVSLHDSNKNTFRITTGIPIKIFQQEFSSSKSSSELQQESSNRISGEYPYLELWSKYLTNRLKNSDLIRDDNLNKFHSGFRDNLANGYKHILFESFFFSESWESHSHNILLKIMLESHSHKILLKNYVRQFFFCWQNLKQQLLLEVMSPCSEFPTDPAQESEKKTCTRLKPAESLKQIGWRFMIKVTRHFKQILRWIL